MAAPAAGRDSFIRTGFKHTDSHLRSSRRKELHSLARHDDAYRFALESPHPSSGQGRRERRNDAARRREDDRGGARRRGAGRRGVSSEKSGTRERGRRRFSWKGERGRRFARDNFFGTGDGGRGTGPSKALGSSLDARRRRAGTSSPPHAGIAISPITFQETFLYIFLFSALPPPRRRSGPRERGGDPPERRGFRSCRRTPDGR